MRIKLSKMIGETQFQISLPNSLVLANNRLMDIDGEGYVTETFYFTMHEIAQGFSSLDKKVCNGFGSNLITWISYAPLEVRRSEYILTRVRFSVLDMLTDDGWTIERTE